MTASTTFSQQKIYSMSYKIVTTYDFAKEAKRLSKKYPSFKSDLGDFISSLQDNPFQGVELYKGIRKIRLSIKSKGKGKSGGARVITFNALVDSKLGSVVLLLLYDKEETAPVKLSAVKQMVLDLGLPLEQAQ